MKKGGSAAYLAPLAILGLQHVYAKKRGLTRRGKKSFRRFRKRGGKTKKLFPVGFRV